MRDIHMIPNVSVGLINGDDNMPKISKCEISFCKTSQDEVTIGIHWMELDSSLMFDIPKELMKHILEAM